MVFGRDLLGYTVKAGRLYVNEEEAEVVRAIFHKYTNEQKGTYVIARELMEEGIQPKRGDTWSNTMILKVLKNEKYAAIYARKKQSLRISFPTGKRKMRVRKNGIFEGTSYIYH